MDVTDTQDPSSPSTWVRRALEFRASGDVENAKMTSLRGAKRARNDPKIPERWAAALSTLDQAELDQHLHDDATSQQRLDDALTAALEGLDDAAEVYGLLS